MIRTLTLNPAIDKSVTIDRFSVGQVNRISSTRLDAGGKGLNVARVLHHAGAAVLAVAPVGGATGRLFVERVAAEGIPLDAIPIPDETRTNLKVVDRVSVSFTDINEPGPTLVPQTVSTLGSRLLANLGEGDWVVFSGSVPSGVDKGIYGQWIAQARSQGVCTVLDAEGEAFSRGLEAGPQLIKPNRTELEAWFGRRLDSEAVIFQAVEALRRAGAQTVALSLGSEGAWLFPQDGAWFSPGLAVEANSTVGAGDALVAGLVLGLSKGWSASETLANAVALATASVVRAGTGAGDPRDVELFRARVMVHRVR